MIRYFISAELSTLAPEVNALRTRELHALLKGYQLHPRQAVGRYKGIDEISFMIEASPDNASRAHSIIQSLAKDYGQESLLILQDKRGVIESPSGERLAELTLVQESIEDERPKEDHTAIKSGARWLILRLA